jgi:hypothetical protein
VCDKIRSRDYRQDDFSRASRRVEPAQMEGFICSAKGYSRKVIIGPSLEDEAHSYIHPDCVPTIQISINLSSKVLVHCAPLFIAVHLVFYLQNCAHRFYFMIACTFGMCFLQKSSARVIVHMESLDHMLRYVQSDKL